MRILVVSALLGLTVACAAPPPQAAAPGSAPTATAIAAFLGPPPPAVALVPIRAAPPASPPPVAVAAVPAAPVAGAVVAAVDWVPLPRVWFEMFQGLYDAGPAGRLTLSNFSYDTARVQAVLTNAPDCAVAEPAATADFVMPLNATRIIAAPPGVDVCWRREVPPPSSLPVALGTSPAVPGWADWNRAYTASGRFIDARL